MESQTDRQLISIIIPNLNGAYYLERCLESLRLQTHTNFEIIVVDNASTDASAEVVLRSAPRARILQQAHNLGFAAAVNVGISAARGAIIAVLNNDTEMAPSWLEECIVALDKHPEAAFLACRILDFHSREKVYSAGDCILRAGIGYRRGQDQIDRPDYHQDCPIFSACGCAAVYRRPVLVEAGGYDESFFAYLEDIDLGLRLQLAGHTGWYAARAEVYHHGGATSGGEFSPLAVRLRTRNSIYLILKNMRASILFRCAPMIVLAQAFWLGRVLAHRHLLCYLRGLIEVLPGAAAMVRKRTQIYKKGGGSSDQYWKAILASERMAREDYCSTASIGLSTFLSWYFKLFSRRT